MAQHNVFATDATGDSAHDGVTIVTEQELALDESYRPQVRGSVLVDAVKDTTLDVDDLDYTTDLTGFQRVMNGFRDAGALEGDWRTIYGNNLSNSRRFSVTTADEQVVETQGRIVRLTDGTSLFAVWQANSTRPNPRYLVCVHVASGELKVSLNGDLVRTVVGNGADMEFWLESAAVRNELAFSFAGEGYADLLNTANGRRFVLNFR